MKKKIYTMFIFCFTAIILSAQIIHVPADTSVIQAAINIATDGDTILVSQGTYFENINFYGKKITVASHYLIDPDSDHINNTIIDGSQPIDPDSASVVMFYSGEDTTSVLCGFTITNGTGVAGTTNYAKSGGGISGLLSGAKIINNKIINNEVENDNRASGGGIGFTGGTENLWVIIKDNIIENNTVTDQINAFGGGIYVSLNSLISNNIIQYNSCISETGTSEGGGIEFQDIFSNGFQIKLLNNKIRYNTLFGNIALGGGITLLSGVFQSPEKNKFHLPNNNTLSINPHPASLKKLNQSNSVESSCLSGNDICFNTIDVTEYWYGAGIFVWRTAIGLKIYSNEIANNSGSNNEYSFGGAIFVHETFDNKVIIDANTIKENQSNEGGGLYINRSYNLLITNNLFLDNLAEIGGAIRFFHYLGMGNNESEIPGYKPGKMDPVLNKRSELHPVIVNNTITENSALFRGGAILVEFAPNLPVIFNTIFWENSAPIGEDIRIDDTLGQTPIFNNNINVDLISGNWFGSDNIYDDPMFIDTSNGDYCLLINSPCICQAIDSLEIDGEWFFPPDLDLNSNPRPSPTSGDEVHPDIGACEELTVPCHPNDISELSNMTLVIRNHPNPFSTSTTLEYELEESSNITLIIYNHLGQSVEILVDEHKKQGTHQVVWDAGGLSAGLYFYKIIAGDRSSSGKMLVVR